jgi:hypothetical protein
MLLGVALGLALAAVPTGAAAAASTTVRMTIVHVLRGCHAWGTSLSEPLGPKRTLVVKRGTKVQIRVNCSMSFDVVQLAGPRLGVSGTRWLPGTAHTLLFARTGVYRLQATNVESSSDAGLQTLGPDNVLQLAVRVS